MVSRSTILALAFTASALAGCGDYRGLESAHQPVVSRSDYALDLATSGYGLAPGEDARLAGWFASMKVGYGDSISLDDPAGSGGARSAVAAQAAGRGLLLSDTAPITTGQIAPGSVRVVVTRATARVPGCPDYLYEDAPINFSGRTSSNYGCGMNSTLAAMVANPADLVRGQPGATSVDPTASTKAIDAYRKAEPSGGGGQTVKSESTGGANNVNAPFNPARAAHREPFAAYVCDETTAETLRGVATEQGWSPDKVSKGGLRNAVQQLSVSASPIVLFVDLSESGDPLNDINALAEVCEPGTIVIAAGQVNDVRLYRDLVASGIQDYLLKPLSPDTLREAFAHAYSTLNAPRPVDGNGDRPHCSAAIIGARGGVGATTIATSLAWLLSDKAGHPTGLLDLDIHFGTGALALDLEPGRGLTDAIENPSRIDGLFIERAMVRASEKLAVLSAEAPINAPLISDGSAFFQLQEEIRAAFDFTIVDMPRAMLVQHPHLITDVQVAVIVTELTLAAARDSIRLLSWLKSNAPQTKVYVVANKMPAPALFEISRKDFEGSIERRIDYLIPMDQKLASQAAKLGKPLAETGKGSKTVAPLAELSERIIGCAEEREADDGGKKTVSGTSLLGRFADLKGLVSKKKK